MCFSGYKQFVTLLYFTVLQINQSYATPNPFDENFLVGLFFVCNHATLALFFDKQARNWDSSF